MALWKYDSNRSVTKIPVYYTVVAKEGTCTQLALGDNVYTCNQKLIRCATDMRKTRYDSYRHFKAVTEILVYCTLFLSDIYMHTAGFL